MDNSKSPFFVDTSDENALDISNESFRIYDFGGGQRIIVDNPKKLWVKVSGTTGQHSHRIETKDSGVYIRAGWLSIQWYLTDKTEKPVSF